MKHAVVDKKTLEVTNIVLWEGHPITWPEHWLVVPSEVAEIGDHYDPESKTFVAITRIQQD